MSIQYSQKSGAFYPLDIDYAQLPDDLIEVSVDDYQAAMARPAGYTFDFVDGKLVLTPPAAPTLDALRAAKLAEINAASDKSASLLTDGYPDFETKTWPDQQREALAWNADNTTPTPRIDAMAAYRGIDRVLYLQKTVSKVLYFQKASDYLVGTRQKYVDQANAAKSQADLDKIVPAFKLPAP